jgi:hypothetical protein
VAQKCFLLWALLSRYQKRACKPRSGDPGNRAAHSGEKGNPGRALRADPGRQQAWRQQCRQSWQRLWGDISRRDVGQVLMFERKLRLTKKKALANHMSGKSNEEILQLHNKIIKKTKHKFFIDQRPKRL